MYIIIIDFKLNDFQKNIYIKNINDISASIKVPNYFHLHCELLRMISLNSYGYNAFFYCYSLIDHCIFKNFFFLYQHAIRHFMNLKFIRMNIISTWRIKCDFRTIVLSSIWKRLLYKSLAYYIICSRWLFFISINCIIIYFNQVTKKKKFSQNPKNTVLHLNELKT